MTIKTEAPTRTLEERVSRAFELAKNIPFSAQIALLRRVSTHIEALPSDDFIATVEPALEKLIETSIKKKNPEALSTIGLLTDGILSKSEAPDASEKRRYFITQVGEGFEQIAKKKKEWILLTQAGEFYQKIYAREEVQRIRAQLENLGDKTGNWRLLAEAAKFYDDWDKKDIQRIAGKLDELTKENDDPALLIATGRFLIINEKTREQGIRLIMEGGNLNEAYKLAKEFEIRGDLNYEVKKRAEEAGEDRIWTHQQLLKGKGYRENQVRAWLKEGKPLEALRITLRSNLIKEASEIIQKHNLQKEAEQNIREIELARATDLANSLGMSELATELAEKAAKYSTKQIEALEQQIWLLQIQIENTENLGKLKRLNEQFSTKQHLLVDLYLNSGQIRTAADYAEKISDTALARQIREVGLEEAIGDEKYYWAITFAQSLGDAETELDLYLKTENYDEALTLALEQKWEKKLIELISEPLSEITLHYGSYGSLHETISFFQARKKEIPNSQELISKIASYLKDHYEKEGRFKETVEMSELLGLSKLAATYKELDSLLPKPVSKGGCYITTACCEVMGLKDDCEILTNLRLLRDNFICHLPDGNNLVQLYYETAPRILEKITHEELKRLFFEAIKPSSDLVKEGKYQEAFELYKTTFQELSLKHFS